MNDHKRILITGAAGRIGSILVTGLKGQYYLRGCDQRPMPDLEDVVMGDLADMDTARRATEGMDAVAHLASSATRKASWEEVLSSDLVATYNLYEAAVQNDVKRVVYTSRAGIFDGYPAEVKGINENTLPRPMDYYSVGKVCGEMLGSMYAQKHGLEVVCIRFGRFRPDRDPASFASRDKFISPRDMVQLYDRALTQPGLKFERVFGVSKNSSGRFDNTRARDVLGYAPMDDESDEEAWFHLYSALQGLNHKILFHSSSVIQGVTWLIQGIAATIPDAG